MDIKVDFDPQKVGEKLAEALLTSTFKELFTKAAKEEIEKLNSSNSWQNIQSIIQTTVRDYFRRTMEDILRNEYDEQIRTAIKAKLEKDTLEKLVNDFVNTVSISRY